MSTRNPDLRSFETRLADSRAEIDKMRIKADEAEADAKAKYEAELEKLEKKQKVAEERLEDMRQPESGRSSGLKGEIERALESLGNGLARVRERLR